MNVIRMIRIAMNVTISEKQPAKCK